MSRKPQMPRNSAARGDSDSGGDDYEFVGSPASRHSSWDTSISEFYDEDLIELQREAAELQKQIRAIQRNQPGRSTASPYVFLSAVYKSAMKC